MLEDTPKELVDAGRGYESLFVPALFDPWTPHVVAGAGLESGQRVLDVACGTGVLARRALEAIGSAGSVVGLDPAPGMLAAAAEIEPAIEWVPGGAESLPFDDADFDCVVSQFGMMFFPDRQAATDEMFRVLKPGGTVAIAVWNTLDNNPAYADVVGLLDQHVSTAAGDALRLPYCLGDADETVAHLAKSGFSDIRVVTLTEQASFPDSRTMVEADLRGWLPLFDIFLDEDKIMEFLAASDATLGKYVQPTGEARFPTSAHVITASK